MFPLISIDKAMMRIRLCHVRFIATDNDTQVIIFVMAFYAVVAFSHLDESFATKNCLASIPSGRTDFEMAKIGNIDGKLNVSMMRLSLLMKWKR